MTLPAVEAWRLFVALPLPPAVAAELAERLAPVRAAHAEARWTAPGAWHLTLRFLGQTPAQAVPAIEAALARVARRHDPPPLRFGGAGTFGRGPARVAWIGFSAGAQPLAELAADVDAALEEAAVAGGRSQPAGPYRAHLTVARGACERLALALAARMADGAAIGWAPAELALMRSHLGGPAVRHEIVRSWRLAGPP